MAGDVDVLLAEYEQVAARVDVLTTELVAATRERDAVLAALAAETGLTQRAVCDLTGLTISRLRTALWNDWARHCGVVEVPDLPQPYPQPRSPYEQVRDERFGPRPGRSAA